MAYCFDPWFLDWENLFSSHDSTKFKIYDTAEATITHPNTIVNSICRIDLNNGGHENLFDFLTLMGTD